VNAVQRLSRITMICSDPGGLAAFYEGALGFERTGAMSITEPAFAALIGIPGATASVITLRLGGQEIELAGVNPPGQNYPRAVSGRSPLFQHFAIVVSDMAVAYARLLAQCGCTAISTDGPQLLPATSGGVTAYKFRDPDGHPLELIAFPPDAVPVRWQRSSATGYLGIDHSAISIADTERSISFYERLGLRRVGGSLNSGPEQDKLDHVVGALVEVTALAPPRYSTPHVELLCYRGVVDRKSAFAGTNDIAATWLVLTVGNDQILEVLRTECREAVLSGPVQFNHGVWRAMLRDPDGHLLCLEGPREAV
jgi:catechol 2,3-dioxygenase-like lactoylglutathione lyase family enzyme